MIIDVRQRNEFTSGHIHGALNIELGELQEHLDGLPRELPVVTVCAVGVRATTAILVLGPPPGSTRGNPAATGEE